MERWSFCPSLRAVGFRVVCRLRDLFVDPSDSALDPFFEPVDFFFVGVADEMVAGDLLAENGPALEVAFLRFLELGGELVDGGVYFRGVEDVFTEFAPAG